MVDFDNNLNNSINKTETIVNKEIYGIIVNNNIKCNLILSNIINHIKNVYDMLPINDKEKVFELYNVLN